MKTFNEILKEAKNDGYDYYGVFSTFASSRELYDPKNIDWDRKLEFRNGDPEDRKIFMDKDKAMMFASKVRDHKRYGQSMSRNPSKGRYKVMVKKCNEYGEIKGVSTEYSSQDGRRLKNVDDRRW